PLPKDFWNTHGKDMESWKKDGHTYYRVRGPLVPKLRVNEFVYDESGDRPLHTIVRETEGRVAVLETLKDYTHTKNEVWGITARDLVRSRIKVKSLNFMRGRTFVNKWLIIDEAQNLTPKQMKTLITRAGPGTKVVCLGNIAQIDTPYLTEGSSGLSYVVDRMKGWSHSGHVTLQRGERSRLADHAAEAL